MADGSPEMSSTLVHIDWRTTNNCNHVHFGRCHVDRPWTTGGSPLRTASWSSLEGISRPPYQHENHHGQLCTCDDTTTSSSHQQLLKSNSVLFKRRKMTEESSQPKPLARYLDCDSEAQRTLVHVC